jgi:hypothetical protein
MSDPKRRPDGGWARTVIRHGGWCGAELGAVYGNESGLQLKGNGIVGSRRLEDSVCAPVPVSCPKCGREINLDSAYVRRAAHKRWKSIAIE